MNERRTDQPEDGESFGLLHCARNATWAIDVDQTLDCERTYLQIESPGIYLHFQIPNPQTLLQMDAVLGAPDATTAAELQIGTCGDAPVVLVRDNESSQRCFLKIGFSASGQVHLSIYDDRFFDFAGAIAQIAAEVAKETAESQEDRSN